MPKTRTKKRLPKSLNNYIEKFSPKQEQILVSFRMRPSLHQEFKNATEEDGVMMARLLRGFVRKYLDDRKGRKQRHRVNTGLSAVA